MDPAEKHRCPTVNPEPGTYLSPATPRILAHRGLALDAPENTLLAFLTALSAGGTHLDEIQPQMTQVLAERHMCHLHAH